MAKLKGPLFSLGASGAVGKALVFFGWKGLNVAREYVIPANPKTAAQVTQRGLLTDAVDLIHTAMGAAADHLAEIDRMAYAAYANTMPSPRTWFNQAVKEIVDKAITGLEDLVFRGFVLTPAAAQVTVEGYWSKTGANTVTAGFIWYGTSPTSLVNSIACTGVELNAGKVVAGLTNNVKYFFQYRATEHVDFLAYRSGIYHATPAA